MGNTAASENWPYQELNFRDRIPNHLAKAGYAVLDMTGFTADQIATVRKYIDGPPKADEVRIIKLGF